MSSRIILFNGDDALALDGQLSSEERQIGEAALRFFRRLGDTALRHGKISQRARCAQRAGELIDACAG